MLKLLVVEDDEAIRKIMGWVLDSLGYAGVLKESGEAALESELSRAADYSVLWVDLSLPGMNGEEFVQAWISALPGGASFPDIIFCSALQEGDLRASAAQLRYTDFKAKIHFLRKPFRLEELDRLLSSIESDRKTASPQAA